MSKNFQKTRALQKVEKINQLDQRKNKKTFAKILDKVKLFLVPTWLEIVILVIRLLAKFALSRVRRNPLSKDTSHRDADPDNPSDSSEIRGDRQDQKITGNSKDKSQHDEFSFKMLIPQSWVPVFVFVLKVIAVLVIIALLRMHKEELKTVLPYLAKILTYI